jgi:uncharacterized protein
VNFSLFIIAFVGVFILITRYISLRFVNKLELSERAKRWFNIFLIINFIGIIFYMLLRYYPLAPNWLFFIFSLPIGVLFLLFCSALIYDISRVLLSFTPISQSRREFFKKSLDITSLSVATLLGAKAIHEATIIEVEHVRVELKRLKKSYKIVQLSDIHIGGLMDEKKIAKIVNRVNDLMPDLVVITGDLVDTAMKYAKPALSELQKLNSIYGTYFVIGNHEYFHGVDELISELKTLGIKTLENENIYIGEDGFGFNLAGVYDMIGYRVGHHVPDLLKALKNRKYAPTILLAHQPKYIDEVGGVDLMLSGHTHGGQIYPFRFLVKLAQPYIDGLHQHDENLQIYVNKGTGFWGPPMRLYASSEITVIEITPKN